MSGQRALWSVIATLFVFGCGDGSLSPNGVDGSTSNCISPSCLVSLTKGCLPAGDCVSQQDPYGNQVVNYCMSNGVSVSEEKLDPTGDTPMKILTVRFNGTGCYSAESVRGAGAFEYVTFRDAAGVAVAFWDGSSKTVTFAGTCAGQKSMVGSLCSSALELPMLTGISCPVGACSP